MTWKANLFALRYRLRFWIYPHLLAQDLPALKFRTVIPIVALNFVNISLSTIFSPPRAVWLPSLVSCKSFEFRL